MPLWFGVKNLDNNGPHLENERKRPWLWHVVTGWSIIFNHHSTYHFILMILISEYFRWTCCEGNWRFIPWPLNDGRDAANLLGVLPSTTSKIQEKKNTCFSHVSTNTVIWICSKQWLRGFLQERQWWRWRSGVPTPAWQHRSHACHIGYGSSLEYQLTNQTAKLAFVNWMKNKCGTYPSNHDTLITMHIRNVARRFCSPNRPDIR